MAKFKITYTSGKVEEVEQSDCYTVEQMINCRFGSCDISGVKVELVGSTEEPKKTEPKQAKPKK